MADVEPKWKYQICCHNLIRKHNDLLHFSFSSYVNFLFFMLYEQKVHIRYASSVLPYWSQKLHSKIEIFIILRLDTSNWYIFDIHLIFVLLMIFIWICRKERSNKESSFNIVRKIKKLCVFCKLGFYILKCLLILNYQHKSKCNMNKFWH